MDGMEQSGASTSAALSLLFNNDYFPEKVLVRIFSFLDPRTVAFVCRLVCKSWRKAVENGDVWKLLIEQRYFSTFRYYDILSTAHEVYPWYVPYVICHRRSFYRNLLPSCCCCEWKQQFHASVLIQPNTRNLSHWRPPRNNAVGPICSALLGTHQQGYSTTPLELLYGGVTTCFLSSTGKCNITQIIDLYTFGMTRKIMELRPPIQISEWFAMGYNFVGECRLEVTLLDSKWGNDNENSFFQHTYNLGTREWYKVMHTFTDYREDVRYVKYKHGVDALLPHSGHFVYQNGAAKLAGATVLIELP